MMWIAIGAVVLGAVILFNSAIRLRNRTREAFSGVDVQLERRHDLVPNLVKTVAAYARHEQETLEEVVQRRSRARTSLDLPARERSEGALRRSLDRLLVLVERYPDLKADANFRRLHHDLVEVEDHLQYARRYYNGTVRDFNTHIQQFPGNLVALLFHFRPVPFFQLDDASERRPPPLFREDLS